MSVCHYHHQKSLSRFSAMQNSKFLCGESETWKERATRRRRRRRRQHGCYLVTGKQKAQNLPSWGLVNRPWCACNCCWRETEKEEENGTEEENLAMKYIKETPQMAARRWIANFGVGRFAKRWWVPTLWKQDQQNSWKRDPSTVRHLCAILIALKVQWQISD